MKSIKSKTVHNNRSSNKKMIINNINIFKSNKMIINSTNSFKNKNNDFDKLNKYK